MNNIKAYFVLLCLLILNGCTDNFENDFLDIQSEINNTSVPYLKNEFFDEENVVLENSTPYSIGDEYIIEFSDSYKNAYNQTEEKYKNTENFFRTSENLIQWATEVESVYDLYENTISSDELMGHTVDLYDTVKDIDLNGDYEYIVASRFSFSDIKDSLIIFDNDSSGNVKIIYNSEEDANLNWLDFQNITGHFYNCPINCITGLDGMLYKPTYSNGDFELSDDNIFYTTYWSNINIHNICYRIEYDGTDCKVSKISDVGWVAKIIYENEEPTNICKIVYTDFGADLVN